MTSKEIGATVGTIRMDGDVHHRTAGPPQAGEPATGGQATEFTRREAGLPAGRRGPRGHRGYGLCALCVLCGGIAAAASDWPAYRADAARSGTTSEKLIFNPEKTWPLEKAWTHVPAQSPRPAWPEPGKELHRLDFDYAPQPVLAGGLVYFGSSADDTVRALDLGTGQLRWRFTTGGPVRFAPAVWKRMAYVVSDDGYLYCLDAATGKLLWKFRGAPRDDRMLGNGRMISRWPIRTGVLVTDATVYFAAGMWPAQGIYVYALDAGTGRQIWCNDSSGDMYVNQPHGGASAFTGVCPQGYILAAGEKLLVPSGRATPAAYDRRTGKLVYYQPYLYQVPYSPEGWGNRGNGGAWATIAGDIFFSPMHRGGGPDIDINIGESDPRPGDGLVAYSLATGLRELSLPGRHRALVAGGVLYAIGNGALQAIDLGAWREKGKLDGCVRWTARHARAYCLALAGTTLFVGGRGTLTAFDIASGEQVWTDGLEGQVRGIAVGAGGRVLVGTSDGTVVCFEHREISMPAVTVREPSAPKAGVPGEHVDVAAEIIRATGVSLDVTGGYALVIGDSDSRLATALASQTDLHVICALPSQSRGGCDLEGERERLLASGLYGSRVVVQELEAFAPLPYASYFADLVVVSGEAGYLSGEELYRVLRPCGGVMFFPGVGRSERRQAKRLIKEAKVPRKELRSSGGRRYVVRGTLPGAGEWRSQWADGGNTGIGQEARVRPPFEILWFGGPGPDRMMSRHWGGAAPLSVGGRVFVAGQHHVIAFDAYNGREVWCRELRGVGRRRALHRSSNFAADDDSIYAAVGSHCHRLDQATGKTLAVYRLPELPEITGPAGGKKTARAVSGPSSVDLEWPAEWQVFGPVPKGVAPEGRLPPGAGPGTIPDRLTVGERTYRAVPVRAVRGKIDFTHVYGGYGFKPLKPGERPEAHPRPSTVRDTESLEKVAYALARIDCPEAGKLTIGAGSDWWMQWFLDGKPFFDTLARGNRLHPYAVTNHVFSVDVTAGEHVLAVMVKAGSMGWCVCSVGGAKYERGLRFVPPERDLPRWGYLSVGQDEDGFGPLILGSYIEEGAPLPGAEAKAVFALEGRDGSLRWAYRARRTILNTDIAFGDGRVFVLDATSPSDVEKARRRGRAASGPSDVARHRGEEPEVERTLVALDMETGVELWRQGGVRKRYLQYAKQVVVAGAGAAYDAGTGAELWQRDVRPQRPPLIATLGDDEGREDDWIIAQPQAYNLRTGEPRTVRDLVTGERRPWRFLRAYGCGPVAGCRKMLFFRSGTAGFFDFAEDGTTTFGGIRPGCSITMIPANGLMILPEGESACTCSYNFQTSLALLPAPEKGNPWYVFYGERSEAPPRHLRINLGAPGDRRDASGVPWLGFPRPDVPGACPVPVRITRGAPEYCHRVSEEAKISGAGKPWIYTSGLLGPCRIAVDLARAPIVVTVCAEPPTIDGDLDDACWRGVEPVPFEADSHLSEPETSLYMSRDATGLYFAYRREAGIRDGKPVPFVAKHPEKDDEGALQDDAVLIVLTDGRREVSLHFAVNCAGGGFDGRGAPGKEASLGWNGEWRSAVKKDARAWTAEIAVPIGTLRAEKIDPGNLQVNCESLNRSGRGKGAIYLTHPLGRSSSCRAFVPVVDEPVALPERMFTVRLHFAEPAQTKPGERVFDVSIQGRTVLRDFDISKEAPGAGSALVPVVREFKAVAARESMTIELVPGSRGTASATAPILCGIEVIAEEGR